MSALRWQSLVPQHLSSRFFISYRSLNRPLAEALERRLEQAAQQVWRDRRNLYTSDDWQREIDQALADCDDVIVLLTEAAAQSENVIYEIAKTLELGKRLHFFATHDLSISPTLANLIKPINWERMPTSWLHIENIDVDVVADWVVRKVLAPLHKTHPLDLRDFERIACRTVTPDFSTLRLGRNLDNAILNRYDGYCALLAAEGNRPNAALLMNAGIIAAHRMETERAAVYFQRSLSRDTAPITQFYYACSLVASIRPAHMTAQALDRAIELASAAWKNQQSPLMALLLICLLWDSQRGRGPKLTELFYAACSAMLQYESHSEMERFAFFVPLHKGLELPVEAGQLLSLLTKRGE